MKHSIKAFLLLFAIVCMVRCHQEDEHPEHKCDHDQHQEENPPEILDVEEDFRVLEEGERVLAETTYPQIRIKANYDNIGSSSYTAYIRDELAPAVIAYYEAALKVKYPISGNLKITSSTQCGITTPKELKTGVAADYYLIINSRSEDTSILATSKYCSLSSGSKRPIIANTNFNRQMFKVANGDVLLHEKNTYLLLHEMMHTLGFSKSVHKYYVNSAGKTLTGHVKSINIAGATRTVIDVPSLTEKVRNYYGCSSLPGLIMENGDGSHLEKKFHPFEVMAASGWYEKRVSQLSLGLLEASGWYEVDFNFSEPYYYGQGQGCNFISQQCSSSKAYFEEFCTGSSRKCTFQGHGAGSCSSDSRMDGCRFVNPSTSYNCERGSTPSGARLSSVESYVRDGESRCFSGTLSTKSSASTTTFCFKYNCVGSGADTQLQVILGSKTATCTKEGTVSVSGYKGTINCPDPLTFCSTVGVKYCPRNCMGRGECVDNKCVCNSGFKGIDCAFNA